jgi:hypothetical protein
MSFYLFIFFIQLSLLASLTIYFQDKKDIYLRLFPLFLLVTDIVEILGNYVASHHGNTTAIYNPFEIFEFCFYFFMLMRIIQNKRAKKIVLGLSLLYLLFALYNVLFGQKEIFNSMSYTAGALLTVAICIYYFFELFQYPQSVNLLRQPAFWICSGLLFFYSCTFPIFGLANFFGEAPRVIINNVEAIINIINVFLYSSFTIAFLCGIRIRKSTL